MTTPQETADLQYQVAHAGDNRSQPVVVAAIVMTVLATLVVIIRLWSRRIQNVPLWYDDYVIVLSLLLNSASTLVSLLGVRYGLGKHAADLPIPTVITFVKVLFAYEIGYTVVITFTKISILLMYHRIFPLRSFTKKLYFLAAVTIAWCITCIVAICTQCTPLPYFWDRAIPGGHCVHLHALYTGVAGVNIVTDLAILLVPVRQVWKLNMKMAQKLAVSCIFLLGAVVCVASLIRAVEIFRDDPVDVTFSHVDSTIWCCVETFLGIICACLPVMWPILKRAFRKPLESRRLQKLYSSGSVSSGSGTGRRPSATSHTTHNPTALFSFSTAAPVARMAAKRSYSQDPSGIEEGRAQRLGSSSVGSPGAGGFGVDEKIAASHGQSYFHTLPQGASSGHVSSSSDGAAEKYDPNRRSFPPSAHANANAIAAAIDLDPRSRTPNNGKVQTEVSHGRGPHAAVVGGPGRAAGRDDGSLSVPEGAIKVKKEIELEETQYRA